MEVFIISKIKFKQLKKPLILLNALDIVYNGFGYNDVSVIVINMSCLP